MDTIQEDVRVQPGYGDSPCTASASEVLTTMQHSSVFRFSTEHHMLPSLSSQSTLTVQAKEINIYQKLKRPFKPLSSKTHFFHNPM